MQLENRRAPRCVSGRLAQHEPQGARERLDTYGKASGDGASPQVMNNLPCDDIESDYDPSVFYGSDTTVDVFKSQFKSNLQQFQRNLEAMLDDKPLEVSSRSFRIPLK
jgi:hypothetical protein